MFAFAAIGESFSVAWANPAGALQSLAALHFDEFRHYSVKGNAIGE